MENEISTAEEGQDAGSSEGESGVDMSNSSHVPAKTGEANPKMSKQLQVCITHVNLSELGSHISNDGATVVLERRNGRGRPPKKHTKLKAVKDPLAPQRGRGRPKGPGSKKQSNNQEGSEAGPSKKRGRPKGSSKKTALKKAAASEAESEDDVSNEASGTPGRGRPRKHKLEGGEEDDSPRAPSKRGKQGFLLSEAFGESSEEEGIGGDEESDEEYSPTNRKSKGAVGSSKSPKSSKVPLKKRGRPRMLPKKRGRPRKLPLKMGRPRKHPVKPKEWKPLGRPRKYPRVDPPESTTKAPRPMGRPRKGSSKRGTHLRKNKAPAASSPPGTSDVGPPRKRGRPPGVKKSTLADEMQPESAGENHSSAVEEAGEIVDEMQLESAGEKHSSAVEEDGEIVSQEKGEYTGEVKTVIDQEQK